MASITTRVLELMRSTHPSLGPCVVCGRGVDPRDERLRLPRGGYAHRGCSTYRMRHRETIARRLRARHPA